MSNKSFKGNTTPTGRAITEPQIQYIPAPTRNSLFSHAGTITGRWPSTSKTQSNNPKGDSNE